MGLSMAGSQNLARDNGTRADHIEATVQETRQRVEDVLPASKGELKHESMATEAEIAAITAKNAILTDTVQQLTLTVNSLVREINSLTPVTSPRLMKAFSLVLFWSSAYIPEPRNVPQTHGDSIG